MADVRDILINLIGRETVSPAADKAERGLGKLGDRMDATADDANRLDREIEHAEAGLRDLAVQFARTQDAAERLDLSKSMRKQQTEIRRLVRSRDLLPDFGRFGEAAAERAGVSFVAKLGPLLTRIPLGPWGAAIGGVLGAAIVPALGAAVGGAVLGGAAGVGVVGGLVLAAKDSRVQAAAQQLGQTVMGDLEDSASRFVTPTIAGLDEIRSAWGDISDDIDGSFRAASRYVQPLARGVAGLARELGPGLREGIEAAGPVIREVSDGLPRLGRAVGDLFRTFADNADEGASALRFFFQLIETGIHTVGGLVDALSWVYRQTLEIGEAGAAMADTLWGWLPGAGDKIKEGRARIAELKAALEGTGEAGQTGGERAAGGIRKVGEAAEVATPPVKTFGEFLDESIGRAFESEEAAIRQAEAFDRLKTAAKEGADKGINPNTEAGRNNRRALLEAAAAANANAASILEVTGNHELASEATEQGRRDFLKAAAAMGVEKGEAIALANKLFGIPKKVDTKANVDTKAALAKLQTYNQWLSTVDRDVYNRVITTTVTRRSARGGHQEFSRGGFVDGPGPKGVDSVAAVLAPGEGVLTAREIDQLGGKAGFEQLRAAIRGGGSRPAAVGSYAGNTNPTVVHHTYQIAVNVPPTANLAEAGRRVVEAIEAYERGSGKRWRS